MNTGSPHHEGEVIISTVTEKYGHLECLRSSCDVFHEGSMDYLLQWRELVLGTLRREHPLLLAVWKELRLFCLTVTNELLNGGSVYCICFLCTYSITAAQLLLSSCKIYKESKYKSNLLALQTWTTSWHLLSYCKT